MRILKILISLFILQFIFISDFTLQGQDIIKIDSLQYLLEISRDDSAKVYLNVSIAKEYFKNDVILSLDYGEKALAIAEKSGKQKLISYALFNMGVSYYQQGVMEPAIKHFYRYLEINNELHNEKAVAYALTNIGAIYLEIKELDKAAEYFEKSLAKFKVIYTDKGIPGKEAISIYNNLGLVAKDRHQTDLAIDYYRRGISLARKTPGFTTELANLLNNLGTIYLESGKQEEAIIYMNEALQIRQANDDRCGLINSYIALANYHRTHGANRDAIAFLRQALALADKVGTMTSAVEAQKLLFAIYQEKQMADSALKYHILYTQNQEKLNLAAAMKELKQSEISLKIREKKRMIEDEMEHNVLKFKLFLFAIFLIAIILGLLFILRNSRSRRLRLEKENIQLNADSLELEKARLEAEIDIQNKKIATTGIYEVQKNEIINNIILKLQKQHFNEPTNHRSAWIREIINELKAAQNLLAWNEFELRFQQVHTDFFRKLNEINPGLSPNDRRLCAFLKLNMTSKEISSITRQSYRSIEVARTRLRKKLGLTNSATGLIEFLSAL